MAMTKTGDTVVAGILSYGLDGVSVGITPTQPYASQIEAANDLLGRYNMVDRSFAGSAAWFPRFSDLFISGTVGNLITTTGTFDIDRKGVNWLAIPGGISHTFLLASSDMSIYGFALDLADLGTASLTEILSDGSHAAISYTIEDGVVYFDEAISSFAIGLGMDNKDPTKTLTIGLLILDAPGDSGGFLSSAEGSTSTLNWESVDIAPVPEPGSALLFSVGCLALLRLKRGQLLQ